MFQNLISNFYFGCTALTYFFETFPRGDSLGWLVGNSDFKENPVVHFDLDFDLGFDNNIYNMKTI